MALSDGRTVETVKERILEITRGVGKITQGHFGRTLQTDCIIGYRA